MHMVKTTLHIIGAANTVAPNLVKILTLFPFFSLRLHQYLWYYLHGSTNTVVLQCRCTGGYKEKRSVSSTITNRLITPNNLAGVSRNGNISFFKMAAKSTIKNIE